MIPAKHSDRLLVFSTIQHNYHIYIHYTRKINLVALQDYLLLSLVNKKKYNLDRKVI